MVVTICHDGYVRFWKIDLGNEKATNNFESGFKDSKVEVVAKVSLQDIYYRNQSLRDMFLGEVDENIPADKI